MKRDALLLPFAVLLSFFYGVIAVSQVLGLARLYKVYLVIPLALITAGLVFYFYARQGQDFHASFVRPTTLPKSLWLTLAFLVSGLAVYLLLVFYPLVHWPYSPITASLPWDAGLYHFPKAVEMISTGSAWDLSISYGEYPFGYESLVAFVLALNHAGYLLGTLHALIASFLLLSIALLVARYTKLPRAPLVLLIGLLFLGYQIARNFDSNIWFVFWSQVILIGKNDLFLAAALLAVLVFTPFSEKGPFFPFGLGLASAVALSIKPNSALVVLFAWLLMLFFLWRARRFKAYFGQLVASACVILPGVLWIGRNLIAQGMLFSQASLTISAWSIASNLTNPYLTHYIPQHLYIGLGITLVCAIAAVFRRPLRLISLAGLVLLATFALTPASAFFGSNQQPADIAWRFGMAWLAFLFILLLVLFEPLILPVYGWIARRIYLAAPLALAVLALGGWLVWTQRDLMNSYPQKATVLHDPFTQPVGVDGYTSAYDYVQKNVQHSVVIVENGLPYYLYDAGFTNSVTRSRPADYIVYIKDNRSDSGGYPVKLDGPDWSQTWSLVYQDSQGRVYKRK